MGALAAFSRREVAFVAVICFSLTFQATNFAMMAAFFPIYAADVGVSITQTNLVFISYSIAKMAMSPVAGALASRYGRRPVLIAGVLLVGCSTIFIGLTPDLTQREVLPMVTVMTTARALQGIGLSCSQLATFAMLSDAFPTHRGLVSGSAICAIGLGWAIGPPIGGLLFVAGGFRLPFVVMGAVPLCLLCPLLLLTPRAGGSLSPDTSAGGSSSSAAAAALLARRGGKTPFQLVAAKPDVWIVAFTAFGYMSKWGWWDIQFTTWCVSEFDWGIETSSLFMGMLAGIFALLVPLGGWLGDHPKGNRMLVMAVSLATLAVIYTCMGPWQLLWALETRRKVLVPYIVMEGVLCPLLEPIFLPQMIDTAMEDYEEEDAVDEHVTNYVTSLFQTAFNLGQVVGPFLGAYFIELYGFRGALIRWAGVFGVVSAGLTVRLLSRRGSGATGRRRRPTSGVGEAGVDGETRASEYEPLVAATSKEG